MEPIAIAYALGALALGTGAGFGVLRLLSARISKTEETAFAADTDPTLSLLKRQFAMELSDVKEAENQLTLDLEQELQLEEQDLQNSIADYTAQTSIMDERLNEREVLQKDGFQEYKAREREFFQRRKELRAVRDVMFQRLEEQAHIGAQELLDAELDKTEALLLEEVAQEIRDKVQEVDAAQVAGGKNIAHISIPCMPRHKYTLSGAIGLPLSKKAWQRLVQDQEGRIVGLVETLLGVRVTSFDNGRELSIQGQDLVASEIARLTLAGLGEERKVDRDIVLRLQEEATEYFERGLYEEGKKAMDFIRVRGVNRELLRYVGKLKYRTSFGQNALGHTIEVAMMAGAICAELGLDAHMARRAGLLHDVGKSINVELSKSHVEVGQDLTRAFHEPDVVVNAVAYHHFEEEPRSLEAVAVQIGDAISASRPGARYETKDNYFERIEGLRAVLAGFKEVERGYVASAGREVRAHVNPYRIKDDDMPELAQQLAKKIGEDLTFPGNVSVHVVREFMAVEHAKQKAAS